MRTLLDELTALEAELHHAGRTCSRPRLEQLLHAGFHEVGRSGRRYDCRTVLDYLGSHARVQPAESTGHELHLLGDGCALLTYRSAHPAADGSAPEVALRSSVWLRTREGWQLFYHQGTPAAATHEHRASYSQFQTLRSHMGSGRGGM